MRLWLGVSPREMCSRHLCGEHNELHKLVGCLRLGKQLIGYAVSRLIEPTLILQRHEELREEMEARYGPHHSVLRHQSRMPATDLFYAWLSRYSDIVRNATVDREESRRELFNRCPVCRERRSDEVQKD